MASENNKHIRVRGCIHGLDQEDPKMPTVACQIPCVWRVRSRKNFNCAWKVFSQQKAYTLREVGDILGTTHESVRNIEKAAIEKISRSFPEENNIEDVEFSATINERTTGHIKQGNKRLEVVMDMLFQGKRNTDASKQ